MRSFKLLIVVTCAVLTAESVHSAPSASRISAPGATVIVEFAEKVDDAVSRDLLDWIDHVADQVSMPYGRFPIAATRVVIIPTQKRSWGGDSPVPFGRVTRRGGEAVELYVDVDRPIADMYADWTATHEFSHLLLPKISWRQKWISEGFASYYQNVLMARAGQYSQAQAVRKLSEGFDRGQGSRPELSPNQAAEEGVRYARYKIYWSGAAIALLADLRLRSRSGGNESLDTVLGRFQQCCLPSKKSWSGVQFFTRLDSLIDEPVFMPLYREYADTPGFPDINTALSDPLLARAGLGCEYISELTLFRQITHSLGMPTEVNAMKTTLQLLLLLTPVMLLNGCGQNEASFSGDIQPIVAKNCISCHSETGEGALASNYLMTDYNGVMRGTTYGPVVVPGSRMSSSLYLMVAGKTAPEIRMPPHNPESLADGRGTMLSAQTIEMFGLWIDQGAKNN